MASYRVRMSGYLRFVEVRHKFNSANNRGIALFTRKNVSARIFQHYLPTTSSSTFMCRL